MDKSKETEEFNWAKEFPKACNKNGNFEGFDVVIVSKISKEIIENK